MSRMSELQIEIAEQIETGVFFEDVVDFVVNKYNFPVEEAEKIVYDIEGIVTLEQEARYQDMMDGDHQSALASVGWGTDEDYGYSDFDYQ